MMEKYGVEQSTYEVVIPEDQGFQVIGSYLNLEDATKLQQKNPNSIVRPE